MARLSVRLPAVVTDRLSVIIPGSPEASRRETVVLYFENDKKTLECILDSVEVVPSNMLPLYVVESWHVEGSPSEFIGKFYGIAGLPEDLPVTIYHIEH